MGENLVLVESCGEFMGKVVDFAWEFMSGSCVVEWDLCGGSFVGIRREVGFGRKCERMRGVDFGEIAVLLVIARGVASWQSTKK